MTLLHSFWAFYTHVSVTINLHIVEFISNLIECECDAIISQYHVNTLIFFVSFPSMYQKFSYGSVYRSSCCMGIFISSLYPNVVLANVVPSDARPNSIFFDDVACDKQDAVKEYSSMGHHANVDCFYLCQTYARIPKHLIHDNANLLILFK